MARRIQKHATRLSQVHEAALDTGFAVGQRVQTIDGLPGRVLFVSTSFSPGITEYEVMLDNSMGQGTYTASQLRPIPADYRTPGQVPPGLLPAGVTARYVTEAEAREAALEAEAAGLHLASEYYPEMGDILHSRPDPGKEITVIGRLHEHDEIHAPQGGLRRLAAATYGRPGDARDEDYNGGPQDLGMYWAGPGEQEWVHDNLGPQEEAPPPLYTAGTFADSVMARLHALEEADRFFGSGRLATTVNGEQIDDHGDAPQHGTIPRAADPNAYDGQSTEGDGDPRWSDPVDPAHKKFFNGATVGMYPEGISGGDGPGISVGPVVASRVPWTDQERAHLHSWDNGAAAAWGDFVPSSSFTNRQPVTEQTGIPAPEVTEEELRAQASMPEGEDVIRHLIEYHGFYPHEIGKHGTPEWQHHHEHTEGDPGDFGHMHIAPLEHNPAPWAGTDAPVAEPAHHERPWDRPRVMHTLSSQHTAVIEQVIAQLEDDYPPGALEWVRHATWSGPHLVPLDQINWSDRHTWTAYKQPVRVGGFVDTLNRKEAKGKRLKPVIMVARPGQDELDITDGHHRSIAQLLAGVSGQGQAGVWAYTAQVDKAAGPWDEMHSRQLKASSKGGTGHMPGPDAPPQVVGEFQDRVEQAVGEAGAHQHDRDGSSLDAPAPPTAWPMTQAPVISGGPAYTQGRKPKRATIMEAPGTGSIEASSPPPGATSWRISSRSRQAHLDAFVAAASNPDFRFHFVASWRDVVAKAKRIRRAGRVRITHASAGMVIGQVGGDHDTYESGIQRPPGHPQTIQHWACGCPWASFRQDKSLPGRLNGRPCSHVMALQFEALSRYSRSTDGTFGRDPSREDMGLPPADVVVKSMPPWTNGGWAQTWIAPAASLRTAGKLDYGEDPSRWHEPWSESLSKTGEMFCPACNGDRDSHGRCLDCGLVSRDLRQEDHLPGAVNVPGHMTAFPRTATPDEARDADLTPEERERRWPQLVDGPYPECLYAHLGPCPGLGDLSRTAESIHHSRPSDFRSEITPNPVHDPDGYKPETLASHVMTGYLGRQIAGRLHFSQSDDGRAFEVHMLHSRVPGRGIASAMMDDLYSHVKGRGGWLDHGVRTGDGNHWWASYREPHPEVSTHHAHPDEGWKEYWNPLRVAMESEENLRASGGQGAHTPVQWNPVNYHFSDKDEQWTHARGYEPPAQQATAALLAAGEDRDEVSALAQLAGFTVQADQANAPWGSENVSHHPPVKPYGATDEPNPDQDPGSYGFLSAPDPANWGGIQEDSYVQMPLGNQASLQGLALSSPEHKVLVPGAPSPLPAGLNYPDVGDFHEDQGSFAYTDRANTAGPSTPISPRDPDGIRMEESARDNEAEFRRHMLHEHGRQFEPYMEHDYSMHARDHGDIDWMKEHGEPLPEGFTDHPYHRLPHERAHSTGFEPEVSDRDRGWLNDMGIEAAHRQAAGTPFPLNGTVPQLDGALAELRDEPEPALPSTTGDDLEATAAMQQVTGCHVCQDGSDEMDAARGRCHNCGRPITRSAAADGTIGGGSAGDGETTQAPEDVAALGEFGAGRRAELRRRFGGTAMGDQGEAEGLTSQAYEPSAATQNPGMGSADEPLSPEDASIQTVGQQQWSGGGADSDEVSVPAGEPQGAIDDIVAAFQRSAAARQFSGGGASGGGIKDRDIAAAAQAFLPQWSPPPQGSSLIHKTADVLPEREAAELISEGRGTRARNLGLLHLEGTHYEDEEAGLAQRGLSLDDFDDDVISV